MTMRTAGVPLLVLLTLSLTTAYVAGQAPAARSTAADEHWTPPRLADGQPDITGVYSNATYTPFERPADLADREFFTPEEAEAYARQRLDNLHNQAPAGSGVPSSVHYDDAIWMSERDPRGMTSLRTSIITQPRNGRLPPMNAEGQRRAAERTEARRGVGPLDSAQSRSLSERCIIWQHEGPPIAPTGYNSHIQIHQGPGVVVIMHEMMRDPRVVFLDGRPRPGPGVRSLRGISRGRWEGNTLVVETTQFTERTNFRGASKDQRVIERFTPVSPETIRYEFTVEDPTTWDEPWSGEYPLTKTPDMLYEYGCHEGNYGIVNLLRGQRVAEAAERAAQRGN
jgi:hypothetical protein